MENVKTDTEDDGFWIGDKQHGIQFTNEGIYFISIQFFKGDRVIDETTLEYRLIY